MGILIQLDLVQNNRELNVKVLNDDGLTDSVACKSTILANFNVSINKKEEENESDIIVESVRSKRAQPTDGETRNEPDIIVESVRSKYVGEAENAENVQNHERGILLKSVSGANTERNDEEDSLEEYFVVDKIVANRYNPSTKQYEFLLKLKDCQPVNNRWKPVLHSKTNHFPEEDGLLYVQKSKSLMPLKQKIVSQSAFHSQVSENNSRNPSAQDAGSARKNSQLEPSKETHLVENSQTIESNVADVSESFCETLASNEVSIENDLDIDTDSVQSINDVISIKCEPIIEDDIDYSFEPMSSMTFGNHSMIDSGAEDVDISARQDIKPCPTFHQPVISNPFTCNLCGRSFTGIQYLRKHEKIHTKATIFTCSVCSYAFSNFYLLSAHERESHGIYHAPKRRGCPPGPRKRTMEMPAQLQVEAPSFGNFQPSQIRVSSFAKSFEAPPSLEKPFKCPLCVRTFRNEQALALHEGVHNDGHLFPCNICDRVFTYLHALKNHERIHSNVKPVPCSFCGKLFTMESRRKLHERKHRIDLKNQKSMNMIPLDERSRDRDDEADRPYACRYCPKAFRLKHTLVVHTRIHTGEKPFACPLCDYRSSQKISLDCHMRKHEKNWMQAVNY